MTVDKYLAQRLTQGRGVVVEGGLEVACARIEFSRLIAGARQLDEGVVLTDCDRFRRRSDVAYIGTGALASEGERRLHFSILWEVLGLRQEDGRARGINFVSALLQASERFRNVMRVTQIEGRCVHQHAAAFFRYDVKAP